MKYEILKDDNKTLDDGTIVYRIKALKNFKNIEYGQIGGYIKSADSLSQEGDCWVGGDSMVYGNAKVIDNGFVCRQARVYDNAIISDNASVLGEATVCGNVRIYESGTVSGTATIKDNCSVYGNGLVYGNSVLEDEVEVFGDARVCCLKNTIRGIIKIQGTMFINDGSTLRLMLNNDYHLIEESNKKYELTDETVQINGCTLHRIKALKDIDNGLRAEKGDLGGYVENEDNLSQFNDCWIDGDVYVFDNAVVRDDALILGEEVGKGLGRTMRTCICDNAVIAERATIYSRTTVSGNAIVKGDITIDGSKTMDNNCSSDGVRIADNAVVDGGAEIYDSVVIMDNAKVKINKGRIFHNVVIRNNVNISCIKGDIYDDVLLADNVNISSVDLNLFYKVKLLNNVKVFDIASIEDITLKDNVQVMGRSRVSGRGPSHGQHIVGGNHVFCDYDRLKD
jgi:carbonic anhydrase/acetyltransferase-like protein (isoleucine patch superfamily)